MSLDLSRRSFLRLFGAAAAGMALDPEQLLWVPGQKTIFLPSVVPVGNSLLTIQMITLDALKVLEANLRFAPMLNRQYDTAFLSDKTFYTGRPWIGDVVNVRSPR